MGRNYIDIRGLPSGVKSADGKMRISSSPYLYDLAEGNLTGHYPFVLTGYTPTMTTALSDVWSKAGAYAFPAAAASWEVDSSSTDDVGTVIKGNAEGAAQSIVADTGSTTTSLYDASVDFTAATGVAVGDCILLDPKGASPEYGWITDITDAATGTLVVGGGFSKGGNPAGRAYSIVDYSAATGAHVVKLVYLTDTYYEKEVLVCLNGTTNVVIDAASGDANTEFFRLNDFRVVAAGSGHAAAGVLSVVDAATHAVFYGNMLATHTAARSTIYTVPAGKTLFINRVTFTYATTGSANKEYARMFGNANFIEGTTFHTGDLFYPCNEVVMQNAISDIEMACPIKIPEKVDIKITGIASAAGVATAVLRGWFEI